MTEATVRLLVKLAAKDEATKAVAGLRGEIDKSAKSASSFMAVFTGTAAGTAISAFARTSIRELKELSKEFVKTTSDKERLTMRFDLDTGGFGKQAWDEMLGLANKLRVSVTDLSEQFLRMKNMGLAATAEQMSALVAFGRATGKGKAAVDSITLQLAQIKSKEYATREDLRRIAEAGLPAFTVLGEKLGLTGKQLDNIAQSGVKADDIIRALFEGMAERSIGANERFFATLEGIIEGLRVSWENFQRQVMDQGPFQTLKSAMNSLVNYLNSETGRIELAQWATTTAEVVVKSMAAMAKAADIVVSTFQVLNATAQTLEVGRDVVDVKATERALQAAKNNQGRNQDKYQNVLGQINEAEAQGQNPGRLYARLQWLTNKGNELTKQIREQEMLLAQVKARASGNIDDVANMPLPEDRSPFDVLLEGLSPSAYKKPKSKTDITGPVAKSLFDGESGAGLPQVEDEDEIDRELKRFFGPVDRAWKKYYAAQERLAEGRYALADRELDATEAALEAEMDLLKTSGATEEQIAIAKSARLTAIDQQRYELQQRQLRSALDAEIRQLRDAGISAEDTARLRAETEAVLDAERLARKKQLGAQSAELARIELEQSDAWSAGWRDGLQQWQRELNSGFENAKQLATETAQAMSQSFGDFFFDTMRGDLDSFGDYVTGFLTSVQRALANMMGQMATRAVMASFGVPVPGFATGGVVTGPTLATVGEAGPEAIIPLVNGAVPVRFDGGGGTATSQPINLRVQVINQTKEAVSASVSDMRYDAAMREWVVVTVIDAAKRNVMGLGSMLKGA